MDAWYGMAWHGIALVLHGAWYNLWDSDEIYPGISIVDEI